MFDKVAGVYDLVKSHRNYGEEARQLRSLARQSAPHAKSILELACGTGTLLTHFTDYKLTGVDISPEMIEVAKAKLPHNALLQVADMASYTSNESHDVVLCLDGAIGYVEPDRLREAIGTMANHANQGGLIVIEPWYDRQVWRPYQVFTTHHSDDQNGITVVRMSYGLPDGTMIFHVLVGQRGQNGGIQQFVENYRFWLHDQDKITNLLRESGAKWTKKLSAYGPFSRGLILAGM